MDHDEKIARMYPHMDALGIGRSTAVPPAWRVLWSLGVKVPPPLFVPFLPMALATGAFFGMTWGLLMAFVYWSRQGYPVSAMLGSSIAAGVLFGLAMAGIYRYLARKHRLPSWDQYRGAA
ncbi:MAG TPA: DUF6404 family protein [Arenimonas sp.]|uniref:DUF6404 family protein n=1 Tax=Arenimonas sp. TaxID=1872635 RepID=UPI002D811530|nr:DUF6404 family protein [Arenimonas sp.]HEU0154132.1 DUF6404 family protein [Arenimonas sp.]